MWEGNAFPTAHIYGRRVGKILLRCNCACGAARAKRMDTNTTMCAFFFLNIPFLTLVFIPSPTYV